MLRISAPQCRGSSALLQPKGKRPSKDPRSEAAYLTKLLYWEMTFWLWFSTACEVLQRNKVWYVALQLFVMRLSLFSCMMMTCCHSGPSQCVLISQPPEKGERRYVPKALFKNYWKTSIAESFSIDTRLEAPTQMRLSLRWLKQLLTRCFCANAVRHFPDSPPAVLLRYNQTSLRNSYQTFYINHTIGKVY